MGSGCAITALLRLRGIHGAWQLQKLTVTDLARFSVKTRAGNVAERAKSGSGDSSLRCARELHRIGTLFYKNEDRKHNRACQNRERGQPSLPRSENSTELARFFSNSRGENVAERVKSRRGTAFFAALGNSTELARFFTNSRGVNVTERAKIGSGDCSLRRGQGSHRIGTLFCKNEGRKRSGACQIRKRGQFSSLRSGTPQNWHAFLQKRGPET